MDIRNELNREFTRLHHDAAETDDALLERYVHISEGYAEIENVLAVLSDLYTNRSYVAHGKFSGMIDIDIEKCSGYIPSIWEDDIFKTIHSGDLEMKMLQELLFFHYISRLPKSRRFDRSLMQRLRMRSRNGEWIETLHRLCYLPARDGKTIRFALCLYGAMTTRLDAVSIVVDTVTGHTSVLDQTAEIKILSPQETAVLRLIDEGNRSKGIADILGISSHTVSRHRQNIIAKLKVRNSAEACKIARNLAILR